jgi:Tol biopolymer transport system component
MMDADGSNVQRFLTDGTSVGRPSFSPDGRRILFSMTRDGRSRIYTINVNGTDLRQITSPDQGDDYYPAWSWNGIRIAFNSTRDDPNCTPSSFICKSEIYTMNPDGTGLQRITANLGDSYYPTWAPDGSRLAFVSTYAGNPQILTMNPNGSGVLRITLTAGSDTWPAWGPDGVRIAFSSDRLDGHSEIYVMLNNGTGVSRVTTHHLMSYMPSWSPDGRRLAFVSQRDGNNELYTTTLDGPSRTIVRLTNNSADDTNPFWSPLP